MIDERNTDIEKTFLFQVQCNKLNENFEKRRINFHPANDIDAALSIIVDIIQDDIELKDGNYEIAFSDSVTLHQISVYEKVKEMAIGNEITINNPFERYPDGKLKAYGLQPEGKMNIPVEDYIELQKKWIEQLRTTLLSDLLIIGANAITMKGQIISTDGAGNRVAGMIFGPRKVVIVVGKNKLVRDVDEGINRNRNIAAPLNYSRHNIKHHSRYNNPCLETGYCIDCNHPRRACLNTVIIDGSVEANKDRIHVVFVNADLGL